MLVTYLTLFGFQFRQHSRTVCTHSPTSWKGTGCSIQTPAAAEHVAPWYSELLGTQFIPRYIGQKPHYIQSGVGVRAA